MGAMSYSEMLDPKIFYLNGLLSGLPETAKLRMLAESFSGDK